MLKHVKFPQKFFSIKKKDVFLSIQKKWMLVICISEKPIFQIHQNRIFILLQVDRNIMEGKSLASKPDATNRDYLWCIGRADTKTARFRRFIHSTSIICKTVRCRVFIDPALLACGNRQRFHFCISESEHSFFSNFYINLCFNT